MMTMTMMVAMRLTALTTAPTTTIMAETGGRDGVHNGYDATAAAPADDSHKEEEDDKGDIF
jgi:hypothetical protein